MKKKSNFSLHFFHIKSYKFRKLLKDISSLKSSASSSPGSHPDADGRSEGEDRKSRLRRDSSAES